MLERRRYRARRLRPALFERFYRWHFVTGRMEALARRGIRRVLFADLGKNVYAFLQAARIAGLEVSAVGDAHFAAPGRRYRGVPVVSPEDALERPHDAVVVSNTAAVFAAETARRWRDRTSRPVFDWFGGGPPAARFPSQLPPAPADDIPADRTASAPVAPAGGRS